MKTIFKVGDRVFDIRTGWGEVTHSYTSDWENLISDYLVCDVKFDNGEVCHYTKNGALKSLSFTEYGFDKRFTQERFMDYEEYIGKWGKFWNDKKEYIVSKLERYSSEGFRTTTSIALYKFFEPLTEEQLKVLNLE